MGRDRRLDTIKIVDLHVRSSMVDGDVKVWPSTEMLTVQVSAESPIASA